MTETLFERYKEALRAGHVAVVRGRFEDAAAAYREAIAIAPDRAVPRTALGRVHLRLGDPQGALEAYDGALALAPDDDPSILGRAQALVVLRRTAEAALAYDRLVELRLVDGRGAEAMEAARRALAIEPTDARRERHGSLVEELRAAAGPEPEPEPEPVPPVDTGALAGALDDATARGDADGVAAAALAAATAYRAEGRLAAALDACLQGIGMRPADAQLHLLIAELAVDRGWNDHAADTYLRLLRLADLDGDEALAARVTAAAALHLPGDPRFAGS